MTIERTRGNTITSGPFVVFSGSMQAAPTIPEIPVFAGVWAMIEGSWMGVLMEKSQYLMRRRRQGGPLLGASRHVLEAAKVGNKLLVFRVTVIC